MKILWTTLVSALFLMQSNVAMAQTCDPNHLSSGGYGYKLSNTLHQQLWWAEGAYKVMKDAPLPQRSSAAIHLETAKNEWESFILVSRPDCDLEHVNIQFSPLRSKHATLSADDFTVRKVEYVPVTHPTDYYGFKGLWPDPLPLNKKDVTLKKDENNAFWISLKTPATALAGNYKGEITLSGDNWKESFPIEVTVWDFALPDTPTLRSGFGLDFSDVKRYNNIHTQEEKEKVFDAYMKTFSDYKLSPYNPFELSPIHEYISGVAWQGGFFDRKTKHSGKYAYKVSDDLLTENIGAKLRHRLSVRGGEKYHLSGWTKGAKKGEMVIGVECYDENDSLMWFENRFEGFPTDTIWKEFHFDLGQLPKKTHSIMLHLYPTKCTITGEGRGTVWFDDLELSTNKENILLAGDFEIDPENIDIRLDPTDFIKAAKKYFNEYHFNGFNCKLKGLGGGTYYERHPGVFEGFEQGTEEYNRLMQRYLVQLQACLDSAGILGKEYVYWFDEPYDRDYPFIHATNAMIKRHAPKLITFLTEHVKGQDISDVTDISCTIWHNIDNERAARMKAKGLGYWSYICTAPRAPWLSEFIDHDAINFRMWCWGSYAQDLMGILIWRANYWNSPEASPIGKLQNPWTEAMSWTTSYGTIRGKQIPWGNGDGRLLYPENRHPNTDHRTYTNEAIPSVRMELLRDGIEDYEYFKILERLAQKAKGKKKERAAKLLNIPSSIFSDGKTYTKDPQQLLRYRRLLAKEIMRLQK